MGCKALPLQPFDRFARMLGCLYVNRRIVLVAPSDDTAVQALPGINVGTLVKPAYVAGFAAFVRCTAAAGHICFATHFRIDRVAMLFGAVLGADV